MVFTNYNKLHWNQTVLRRFPLLNHLLGEVLWPRYKCCNSPSCYTFNNQTVSKQYLQKRFAPNCKAYWGRDINSDIATNASGRSVLETSMFKEHQRSWVMRVFVWSDCFTCLFLLFPLVLARGNWRLPSPCDCISKICVATCPRV